ncbi:zinc finger protein 567-like, partial [Centruroides sculpturatus]|uniref:zinc finger protein 567-like n=1 Tax=Centruroides sculpturatus TaxID=218467 RepID=UPI000C6E0F53
MGRPKKNFWDVPFSQMNDLPNIKMRQCNEETFSFGLSTLPCHIRFMECILRIAYRMDIKKWQVRETEEKESLSTRKKNIINTFRTETGLLLDTPKQGGGNTNDKRLTSKGGLERHGRTSKSHRYKICNKEFKVKYGLTSHEVTHSDHRPFQCDICNKRFKRKGELKIHYEIYSNGQYIQRYNSVSDRRNSQGTLHNLGSSSEFVALECNLPESDKPPPYDHPPSYATVAFDELKHGQDEK